MAPRGAHSIQQFAATVLITFAFTAPLAAQQSRAESIAQRQDEKAATAHVYTPSKAERIFLAVKKEFLDSPSGLYPLVGSVYSGSGLALGGGYRQYFGDKTFWDAKGLWSIRNSRMAELSTNSQGHAHDRIDLTAQFGWRDATRVANYARGMNSSTNHTNFRLKETYVGGGVKVRPISWIALGAGISYEDYSVERLPGGNPIYLHNTASAGIDSRPSAGYARRGGLYEARYHNYRGRNGANNFDRLDAEVVQHVPLLRENWVISFHAQGETTLDNAANPPVFLLPSLGGGDSLRGYASWRFRDKHSVLLQGEFRWIPNVTGIDMALFYDAGKVTSLRSDINLKGLKRDAGLEIRFHGPTATPLRLGVARGSEGWHVVFGGSAAF